MFRIHLHRAFVEPAVSIERIENSGVKSRAILRVDGLLCSLCAANVNGRLDAVKGVQAVTVDLEASTATVSYDGERVDTKELIAAVEAAIVLKPVRRLLARLGDRPA